MQLSILLAIGAAAVTLAAPQDVPARMFSVAVTDLKYFLSRESNNFCQSCATQCPANAPDAGPDSAVDSRFRQYKRDVPRLQFPESYEVSECPQICNGKLTAYLKSESRKWQDKRRYQVPSYDTAVSDPLRFSRVREKIAAGYRCPTEVKAEAPAERQRPSQYTDDGW